MNATVAIRRATAADRAFVYDLGHRVAATSVSAVRPDTDGGSVEAYDRLVEFVLRRDHAVLVAAENGVALGFGMVLFDLPDEVTLRDQAFLAYMAVEPSAQRRGVGRLLLSALEDLARERGLPHLSLMVTEDNRAAIELYTGADFVTERRLMTKALG